MELALYCPVYGYYEHDADNVGKSGDFQTSVSVGSMFGELLASRFAGWLDRLKERGEDRIRIVEAGAHGGQLASDILGWFECHRPDLLKELHYCLLEPSRVRQKWQQSQLNGCKGSVRWCSDFEELRQSTGGVDGVLFSNELMDALPAHRFAWNAGRQVWFEWLVDGLDGQFTWRKGGAPERSHRAALDEMVPKEIEAVLPDGYVVDYSPAATRWWRWGSSCLKQGWLVTFDYGFDADAMLLPERVNGTLRAYRHHQAVGDVLSEPGETDITAHVHFDRLRSIGEASGLNTEFFGTQERFLVQVMEESTRSTRNPVALNPARQRQFKTLIHPDHFGHSFKALVQSKL